jgi:hypothetical protein
VLILIRLRRIKLSLFIRPLLTSLLLLVTSSAYASSVDVTSSATLKVSPKQCIALHKGQKCYLEVTFNWQHPEVGDYCLVNTSTSTIIKCWQHQSVGKINFDFQSRLSNNFALRKSNSTIDIAQAQISVAWVYKSAKRSKSTWRLF